VQHDCDRSRYRRLHRRITRIKRRQRIGQGLSSPTSLICSQETGSKIVYYNTAPKEKRLHELVQTSITILARKRLPEYVETVFSVLGLRCCKLEQIQTKRYAPGSQRTYGRPDRRSTLKDDAVVIAQGNDEFRSSGLISRQLSGLRSSGKFAPLRKGDCPQARGCCHEVEGLATNTRRQVTGCHAGRLTLSFPRPCDAWRYDRMVRLVMISLVKKTRTRTRESPRYA
jgi:hypothetical protein